MRRQRKDAHTLLRTFRQEALMPFSCILMVCSLFGCLNLVVHPINCWKWTNYFAYIVSMLAGVLTGTIIFVYSCNHNFNRSNHAVLALLWTFAISTFIMNMITITGNSTCTKAFIEKKTTFGLSIATGICTSAAICSGMITLITTVLYYLSYN